MSSFTVRIGTALGFVCMAVVLSWLSACRDAATLAVTADSKARVLLRFKVAPYEYSLVIDACRPDADDPPYEACPLQIELRASGRLLDRHALPVPSFSPKIVPDPGGGDWGAEFGLDAWTSAASDNTDLSTAARIVQMSPGVRGLLVSQRFGFEHVHRYHVLLLTQHNALVVPWEVSDQLSFGTALTDDVPSSTLGFVKIDIEYGSYREPPGASLTKLWQVLWNPKLQRIEEVRLPRPELPLYLLSAGTFVSVAAAQTANQQMRCETGLLSVDTRNHPGLGKDTILLGEWYVQRSSAKAAARALDPCEPKSQVRLFEYGYEHLPRSASQTSRARQPKLFPVPL